MTTTTNPSQHPTTTTTPTPTPPRPARGGAFAQGTATVLRTVGRCLLTVMRWMAPYAVRAGKWTWEHVSRAYVRFLTWVPQHKQLATGVGVGAAFLILVLVALPGAPSPRPKTLSLSGRDLFLTLCADHASVQRASRVAEATDRGASTNVVVLPDTVWSDMSVEQRNSLGSWLNEAGGRWEIRVGKSTKGDTAIVDAEPVITSQQWNEQLK